MDESQRPAIWREWELIALGVLVAGFYMVPIAALSIRGEEPRRAQVAREMIATGDWVVPRVQGQLFISRPPLQNWVIAGCSLLTGGVNVVSTRLPSIIAMFATGVLIYWYARHCMARLGALAAAAGFVSMVQLLEMGRLGETEIMYTFLVAAPLMIWHVHAQRGPLSTAAWLTVYGLIALGVLAKGLQGPAYFVVAVGAYTVVKGRWRELICWRHAAGIALSLAIWGVWQGTYFALQGWHATRQMYWHDVAMRFEEQGWLDLVEHMIAYPVELLACTMPWSPLLLAYLHPGFRRRLGKAGPHALFMALAVLLALPSCWLVPGAKTRYFMPLYPCVAILIGLVIDRTAERMAGGMWRNYWSWLATGLAVVMVVTGPSLIVAAFVVDPLHWSQPVWLIGLLLVVSTALAVVTFRSRLPGAEVTMRHGVLAIATYMGVAYCGIVLHGMIASTPATATQVARVKATLPPDAKLVSYGVVDPLFLYHFDGLVEVRSHRVTEVVDDDAEYFCLSSMWGSPGPEELPFPWKPVAAVSCDRTKAKTPERVVLIGRRLPVVASKRADRGTDRPEPR